MSENFKQGFALKPKARNPVKVLLYNTFTGFLVVLLIDDCCK
jgi:hypothetical protein